MATVRFPKQKNAQPHVAQEGRARINVKVHVADEERMACRMAVIVESRRLCNTPGTTPWVECSVNAFFGGGCACRIQRVRSVDD